MSNQDNQQSNEINLRELLLRYLKQWRWFVLSIVLCGAIAVFYYFSHTPVFNVSSTLLIRTSDEGGLGSMAGMDVLSMVGLGGSKQVVDELAIINSRSVMQQSIRELGLQTEYRKRHFLRWEGQYPTYDLQVLYPPYFTDTMRKTVKITIKARSNDYKVKVKYGRFTSSTHNVKSLEEPFNTCIGDISFAVLGDIEKGDKYKLLTRPVPVLADIWRQNIHATQVKKESNVVSISTNTDMPKREIDLINKMIDLYNMDAVVDKNIMANNTKKFIDERLEIVTAELADVENDVEKYKRDNGITSLSEEAVLYLQSSEEYRKRKVNIETQQNLLNFIRDFVNDEQNANSFIPVNIGISNESLLSVVEEYNSQLVNRLRIERSATPDNPILAQLDQQLAMMRANVIASINTAEKSLQIMRNDLEEQEKTFAGRINKVPTQEREYVQIARQQEIKQNIYLFLFQKREENALALASTVMPAKTIDRPQMSNECVAPKLRLLALIALVMGIIIPAGIIFIYDFFDNKLKDRKQFETMLKAPFLGQLVQSKRRTPVVISREENTASAELFRLLRTNLRFMLPTDAKSSVILVTSSVNGEGKSFVAINTALSMALLGKRVALVGLDVRKPTLDKYIGLQAQGLLTAYLSDSSFTINDIIVPSGLDANLDVIPAGVVPPNPNELLQSERLDELFAELRKRYDFIFVDSAPTAMVSDTFLLNRLIDMTIFVSRANYTQLDMIEFINKTYEQKRLNNMACVLNGIKPTEVGYGYGYGYGNAKAD